VKSRAGDVRRLVKHVAIPAALYFPRARKMCATSSTLSGESGIPGDCGSADHREEAARGSRRRERAPPLPSGGMMPGILRSSRVALNVNFTA